MKVATFNINGIKARAQALPDWLDEAQPDVVLLQEIKSVDEAFPREMFEERGYNVETHGQKGVQRRRRSCRNCRLRMSPAGCPAMIADEQARWIEATVMGDHERSASVRAVPAQRQPGARAEIRLQAGVDGADAGRAPRLLAGEDAVPDGGRLQHHPAGRGRAAPRRMARGRAGPPEKRAALSADPEPWLDRSLPRARPRPRSVFVLGLSGRVRGTATTASASTISCCRPPWRIMMVDCGHRS